MALLAFVALGAEESAPAKTFKPEELEQIVAPIALYPDSLLAQVFMASTYPLEIVEAARWSKEHPDVKGDALQKELEKQSWDPSVKTLANFPDVLTMMNEKLDWTQKLGDAFLAQQKDVMAAVQRLRDKAMKEGNLKSSKEQTVKTEPAPAGSTTPTTIIIESSDPEVVYVPTYNPTVVYGAWPYPAYPPYYYYPPGYAAGGMFFAFSVGVIVGGGGCCWGGYPNWGTGDIDIDIDNDINIDRDDVNIGDGDRGDRGDRGNSNSKDAKGGDRQGKQSWQHNPEHRKGVQYRDNASQQKFGKASDRQAMQSREQYRGRAEQGRQQMASEGLGNQRDLSGKPMQSRESGNLGGQTRDSAGNLGSQSRDFGGSQSRDFGSSSNRSSSMSSSSRSPGAFSGSSSGSSTRAQSSRGMSSRSAGGMSRGGGRRR
ncbi:MAG TPA: DUF3300 domain-containing protein [Longimicrobiales bacterium]|nr:DUF3300 domain-containing protein [Longimicrobiales bacterium]